MLFSLLLGSINNYASNPIDSLNRLLTENLSQKELADIHYHLAFQYAKRKSDEFYKHAYLAQQISRSLNYALGVSKVNYLLVESNNRMFSTDSLIALLKESVNGFKDSDLKKEEAKTYNQLGILLERQGRYKESVNYYYLALFIFQDLGDEIGEANEKNNIGLIHQINQQYNTAIFFFKNAIDIGKRLNDLDILANAYNNIAICYQEQKKLKKALYYFNLVYEIDKKQNIPQNLAMSFNNLGVIQIDLNNYEVAKSYLFQAIEQKKLVDEYTGLANTFNNLALVYQKQGNSDSALYFLDLAIQDATAESATPHLAVSYKLISEIYEGKGLFLKALKYSKIATVIEDSLLVSENSIALNQLEKEFQDLSQKKEEIEQSEKQKNSSLKANLFIVYWILAIVLLVGVCYYLFRAKNGLKSLQIKQKKIEVQNKILQVKNIEVMQAKEAAEEAANIKSQFISTISHEIRTPLNAIIGVANLLQDSKANEDQIDNLNILKISSGNLLQLVNNILDFSKMEAGKLQLENIDFNLRSLVLDVKELFSIKAIEKGIELVVNYDDKIPQVLKGDPLRINQLLINLVNNAIKFSDSGFVKIEVSVQLTTINHALIYFAVTDTGIGIPISKQSLVFQSFTQADSNTTRKFGGTGLGLSICKRILENLNSKLQLESEVGKGSRFYFTINFEVSRSASVGKSNNTASIENSIQGKRVLIVEDNMMNIMVIRQFLHKWGVVTEIALNGKEGYNRLQESNFDAILMDIHMPEMDGIEATQLIRKMPDERKRNIPIIALTAENEMQFRQKVYEVGMNDYIFKPFNPDDLRERLGYVLYNSGKNTKPHLNTSTF
jgi:signal transduction histidine kinase/ActR/RegA family two-component response regulator/Flp pilus assembly protein TadD